MPTARCLCTECLRTGEIFWRGKVQAQTCLFILEAPAPLSLALEIWHLVLVAKRPARVVQQPRCSAL